MADNIFRSYRGRDALARETEPPPEREGAADPLAELARLIGQSDPHGQDYDHPQSNGFDAAPPSGLDWSASDDGYAEQSPEAEQRYEPEQSYARVRHTEPPRPQPSEAASWQQDHDYADDVAVNRPQYTPTPAFHDDRGDARRNGGMRDNLGPDEPLPGSLRRQPAPFFPPAPHDNRDAGSHQQYGAQDGPYDADGYDDEAPELPRRSGTVVILAVLGLAVLGTAGAFGYRAMFGSSVLPALPPIIKPADGPIRTVPNQAGAPGQADASGRGTGEQFVAHQEQPGEIPAANPPPRIVSTIPVGPGSANSVWPAVPPTGPSPPSLAPAAPPVAAPGGAVFGSTTPPAASAPPPPPVGSKRVHTVTIRPDQQGAANPPEASAPPPTPRPVRPAARPSAEATPPPRSGGPLSIVPTQGEAPPPPNTRVAMARPSAPAEAAPSVGGGYAVQVSSQRSEGEAQAAFRALQVKYPDQLGGRHPVVRRADLGAKGIYYRALVGPFANTEQAARLCSSLKAAGGTCIIQRD